jgi:NADH-quinone oxidoreductase subunit G
VEEKIQITVNGEAVEAKRGQMLIEVTDQNQYQVPRFCYHPKLSVAANCRMCMVEVKGAPKPLPACATPVTENMEVFTTSQTALNAQKGTMEFLLINHPLDCPICDQGGECELQDLAIGHGQGKTRYQLNKRVVKDKNIGPLVSTDMTRCIHCTRCVRFGEEVIGSPNLGTVGRGESTKIDTFLENSLDHELSGNVIDLCPVGALNSKPYRFSSRSWEMVSKPSISMHDGLGSNTYLHVLRNKIKRVVPRTNESINETWISDRDRFSYESLYSDHRAIELRGPLIDANHKDWSQSISKMVETIIEITEKFGPESIGIIASPNRSAEEMYLLKLITDHLEIRNIDSRIKQTNFSNDHRSVPVNQDFNSNDIKEADYYLLIGSNLRDEYPIIANQIGIQARKGKTVDIIGGTQSYLFNHNRLNYNATVTQDLLSILKILDSSFMDEHFNSIECHIETYHHDVVTRLKASENPKIILGQLAINCSNFVLNNFLVDKIVSLTNAKSLKLTYGSNHNAAVDIGLLPHTRLFGEKREKPGMALRPMLESPRKVYILWGLSLKDLTLSELAKNAFRAADHIFQFHDFNDPSMSEIGANQFPLSNYSESRGTYKNLYGMVQEIPRAINPEGLIRTGEQILEFIIEQLDISHSMNLKDLRDALNLDNAMPLNDSIPTFESIDIDHEETIAQKIYQVDDMVRFSESLQKTKLELHIA